MVATSLNWNDVAIFLAVARCGTLRDAAREVHVDASTVSRRLAAFERSLGARLFDRLPSGLAPTTAAAEVLEVALRMEAELHGMGRRVGGRDARMSGVVRLALPRALSTLTFASLRSFSERHPDVQVESLTSDVMADLNGRQADVALRIADAPPPDLVGRRVAKLAGALYASEQYRQAHPAPLDDESHRWLEWAPQYSSKPALAWVLQRYPSRKVALRGLSTHDVLEAVENGIGIGALPCVLASEHLERLALAPAETWSSVWVLTHREVRPTARVRALAEWLAKSLRSERKRIEGG